MKDQPRDRELSMEARSVLNAYREALDPSAEFEQRLWRQINAAVDADAEDDADADGDTTDELTTLASRRARRGAPTARPANVTIIVGVAAFAAGVLLTLSFRGAALIPSSPRDNGSVMEMVTDQNGVHGHARSAAGTAVSHPEARAARGSTDGPIPGTSRTSSPTADEDRGPTRPTADDAVHSLSPWPAGAGESGVDDEPPHRPANGPQPIWVPITPASGTSGAAPTTAQGGQVDTSGAGGGTRSNPRYGGAAPGPASGSAHRPGGAPQPEPRAPRPGEPQRRPDDETPDEQDDDTPSGTCAEVFERSNDACMTEAGISAAEALQSETARQQLAECRVNVAQVAFETCCAATPDDTCSAAPEPDSADDAPVDYGESCSGVLFATNDACLADAGSVYGDLDGDGDVATEEEIEVMSRCWNEANEAFDECCLVAIDDSSCEQ